VSGGLTSASESTFSAAVYVGGVCGIHLPSCVNAGAGTQRNHGVVSPGKWNSYGAVGGALGYAYPSPYSPRVVTALAELGWLVATPLTYTGSPEELDAELRKHLPSYIEVHQQTGSTLAEAKATWRLLLKQLRRKQSGKPRYIREGCRFSMSNHH